MRVERRPRIALVAREVWPFVQGGGLGRYVRATANLLAQVADVTILLPDAYRGAQRDDDPRLIPGVRYSFVPDPAPSDFSPFASLYQAWSASACDALRDLYGGAGPELVEFADFT